MSDPERLLGGVGAEHELERALLGSLRELRVPPQAKGALWGALAALSVETTAAAGTTGILGSLKAAAASKALLAAPLVLAAVTGGALYLRAPSPAPAPQKPVSLVEAPAPSAPVPPPAPLQAEAVVAPPAAQRPMPLASVGDRLARESALLTRARAELRAGNPSAAQATLARISREVPGGALRQEREVLHIEALAAAGNGSIAARLARAFIARHPESPHSNALQRFVEPR